MKIGHKTYLLVWNPHRWDWDDGELEKAIDQVARGITVHDRWSCGHSRKPEKNDRVFLIRLGRKPKGIFASGWITEGSSEGPHWDRERASVGDTARYVHFKYDALLDPEDDIILDRAILKNDPRFSGMHWDAQMSGTRIPDYIAEEVEREWSSLISLSVGEVIPPDEISSKESNFEGAVRIINVNRYERSRRVRRRCIEHYGPVCNVCGFSFEEHYGQYAKGFIHVHHIVPLSEIREEYSVDPIKDLRPVCPNCHAVIHLRTPALSIEEARALLGS